MNSRRLFSLILIAACGASASVGTGTTLLLAEQGPRGPAGVEGPPGPPGEDAYEALSRADDVESQVGQLEGELASNVFDLEAQISAVESDVPFNLSSDIRTLEARTREICSALDLFCP